MKFNSSVFFALVFIIISFLMWKMMSPIIGPIIFGCIIAGVFYPYLLKIEKQYDLKRTHSSWIICLLIIVIVIVPIGFMGMSLSKEVVGLYQKIVSGLDQEEIHQFLFGEGYFAGLVKKFSELSGISLDLDELKLSLMNFLKSASGSFIKNVNGIVGDIFRFIFDLIIMLIVVFGIFMQGENLKHYIFKLSPLPADQEEKILKTFNQMNYVTLVCNGVGGVLQGVLAGVALLIAGFDSVFLWTFLMILLAFIPLVGISIVTLPAGIYLLLTGSVTTGIIFLIFTALVAVIVENWFKPKFIGNRIKIDSTYVLLAIIGGMGAFGMGGIFYGPIIGILFLTIVEIYHDNYSPEEVEN